MITAERLRELLTYDPETGVFTCLRWRGGTARAGTEVGSLNNRGYRCIAVDGRKYLCSHLAFLYMTGRWPQPEIDHRNRIRTDDRWQNLREATSSQNKHNTSRHRDGSSRYKGVHWNKKLSKWGARINNRHIGSFATEEDAHAAYVKAAHTLFGEYASEHLQEGQRPGEQRPAGQAAGDPDHPVHA